MRQIVEGINRDWELILITTENNRWTKEEKNRIIIKGKDKSELEKLHLILSRRIGQVSIRFIEQYGISHGTLYNELKKGLSTGKLGLLRKKVGKRTKNELL